LEKNPSLEGNRFSTSQEIPRILLNPNVLYCYINNIQQDATVCRYLFTAKSLSTCFGFPSHPSSGVHKTVTAASGIWATTFLQCGQIGHVGGRLLLRYYDLYQRLHLQFYVLLMMGVMEIRNM